VKARFNSSVLTGVTFRRADLTGATMSGIDLTGSNMLDADLSEADFSNSCISNSDLRNTKLMKTNLQSADLSNTNVSGISLDRRSRYKGIRVDSCYGSQMFKTLAMDQCFIEEYKCKHKYGHFFWKLFSDCGRSMSRWLSWCVVVVMFFSYLHYSFLKEEFNITDNTVPNFFDVMYYNVMMFVTLGVDKIQPNETVGRVLIVVELIVAYIMLGGLVSIFTNRLAKRS
jgi:hypothetical protein